MQHLEDPSSTEKKSPSIYNIQPNKSISICVCGKVVFDKPVTLSCGHQYHFKCARVHVFTAQNESDENKCILCKNPQSSFLTNDSHSKSEMDEEEENDSAKGKFQKIILNNLEKNKMALKNNSNTSMQNSTHNNSNEQSFKYQTPNTTKYPKQSRYSNYQDSNSTNKQNQMNSFMLSPAQASLKNTQERIPFTDITAQINKNSSMYRSMKNKFSLYESNEEERMDIEQNYQQNANNLYYYKNGEIYKNDLQPFTINEIEQKRNNSERNNNGNYIQVLGERLIQWSQDLQNSKHSSSLTSSSSSSSYNQRKLIKNEIIQINLSGSDIMQNLSLSSSSLMSNSFFQPSTLTKQLTLPLTKKYDRIRQILNNSQVMTHSFNNSMISLGSDKENARNITTRRKRNNVLQVSFYEGVSYMCPQTLYSQIPEYKIQNQNQKQQIELYDKENYPSSEQLTLPFCIELCNLYNTEENKTFRNTQDILILVLYDSFTSEQRLLTLKSIFSSLDQHDSLSLAWMDTQSKIITKTSSDYFFGKDMSEIISMEFMRLQGNMQSQFNLISKDQQQNQHSINDYLEGEENIATSVLPQMKQKTVSQFVLEQFQMIQNKRMIQHFFVIRGQNTYLELLDKIDDIENTLTSIVTLPESLLQNLDSQEFSAQCQKLFCEQLDQTRSINIKKIKISLEINPFLSNLIDISLINSAQIQAQVQKTTQRHVSQQSASSENLMCEDEQEVLSSHIDQQNCNEDYGKVDDAPSLKKLQEISIGFLRKDKIELLFEVTFSKNIAPVYTTARLFNCNAKYSFIYSEPLSSSNDSLTYSINSQIEQLQLADSNLQGQFQGYFEEFSQSINDLYYLVEWRKDTSHLRYNRKVMFSLWKHEIQQLPTNIFKQVIYDKYKRIFDSIAEKKKTTDFEEFIQFTSYYANQ